MKATKNLLPTYSWDGANNVTEQQTIDFAKHLLELVGLEYTIKALSDIEKNVSNEELVDAGILLKDTYARMKENNKNHFKVFNPKTNNYLMVYYVIKENDEYYAVTGAGKFSFNRHNLLVSYDYYN